MNICLIYLCRAIKNQGTKEKRKMADEVMVIFTGKSLEQCFEVGGTQSWVLSPAHARRCKYAILCQNAYAEGDWAEGKEPHGKAFMIGRIAELLAGLAQSRPLHNA
jgi:hypothetical protein